MAAIEWPNAAASSAAAASSIAMAVALISAGAQASTESIEARLRQLEALQRMQAGEIAKLRKQVQAAKAATQKATKEVNAAKEEPDPNAPPPPPPIFVSLKSGLLVETEDKAYSFKVGGRIFVDGGGISQPLNGLSNQVGIRQARLEVVGKAAGIWFYKLSYDFAGTLSIIGANQTLGGIRDAYLGIQPPLLTLPFTKDPAYLMIGNMFEPFSLSQQSPILYHELIERPLPVDTFSPSRHIGLAVGAYGDDWSAKFGIFSTSVEDRTLTPAPGVPALWGIPRGFPWVATGGSQYFDIAGRLTYAPIKDEHSLVHFGVSGRYHQVNDATGANDDRVLNLGARIKSEAFILNQTLLGTPDLSCGTITAPVPTNVFNASNYAAKCTKNVETFDVEFAAAHGPFSIQGEYIGSRYNRDRAAIDQAFYLASVNPATAALNPTGIPLVPLGGSAYFSGYYVQASYWLTGEERAQSYDVANKNGAAFTQLGIKNPLSAGGLGAWGVAVRFSSVDLNNGPFEGNRLAGLLALAAVTANRPLATVVANTGIVAPLNGNLNQSYSTGAHPNLIEMRAKVYF